jgi:hypothetical protein
MDDLMIAAYGPYEWEFGKCKCVEVDATVDVIDEALITVEDHVLALRRRLRKLRELRTRAILLDKGQQELWDGKAQEA